MTALSPLANLIAALQVQLMAAAPAPENAPAPFLDVFDGLMEPAPDPEPQPEKNLRSQTGSDANPAPPKAKKTPDTREPVVTAQVMPTPEIVPMVQIVPIVAAMPVLAAVATSPVEAPAPATAPLASDSAPVQPEIALKSGPTPKQPVAVREIRDAVPLRPEPADTPARTNFQETLRSALEAPRQNSRPTAPDRPVQAEECEVPIPAAAPPKPPEILWKPQALPPGTAPTPHQTSRPFDPPVEAAPPKPTETSWDPQAVAPENPRMTHQPVQSFESAPPAPRPPSPTTPAPEREGVRAVEIEDRELRPSIPLAFAAKLVPAADPAAPEPDVEPKPQPKTQPKADATTAPECNVIEPDEPPPPRTVKIEAADTPRERKAATSDNSRERKIAPADAPDPAPVREAAQDSRAILPPSSHETAAPAARAPEEAESTPAAPRNELPAEVSKPTQPPAAARDIRLELAGGDRKVEVRLMERGGEVHVAVRTPDTQLAGALRENLPSLSARLEQTGMRTESWHPGTEAAAERRMETAQSPLGESGERREHSHSQGREQRDRHPRRSHETEGEVNRKEKGTSFSWFMPSHT